MILCVGRQKFTVLVPKFGNVKWKLPIFFLWWWQLWNLRSFIRSLAAKLSPYLEEVSKGSHEIINTCSEGKLRNSVFSFRVRAYGSTASIRMYLEHTTQLRKVQYTGKCLHVFGRQSLARMSLFEISHFGFSVQLYYIHNIINSKF
jgi:hypothetical protein